MKTRALVLFSFLFLLACRSGEPKPESTPKPEPEAQRAEQGYLFPEFGGVGLCQSPINISSRQTGEGHHQVQLDYGPSRQRIVNKGTTIELDYDEGSTITMDGKTYRFRQFHFHTPSEHLIDGVTYPMEMHLVHTLEGNDEVYLVAAILFKEGEVNPFLAKFLDAVPEEPQGEVIREQTIDVRELQDGKRAYYSYQGSLTTPPYTETVSWFVLRSIREASPEQIAHFQRLEGNNARHIQPLYGRKVESD